MMARTCGTAVVASLLTLVASSGYRQAATEQQSLRRAKTTITGNVLSNVHTGEKDKSLFVIAYDGTPEIKAEFEELMAEYYPDEGLDADAAQKLQDQFMARLRYDIDGPLAEKIYKEARWTVRGVRALTGVVEQRDGKKWITVDKYEEAKFAFPAKMLAPDKPFVMPEKRPLTLKINDHLGLKCIWVPSGKLFMGEPYYQCPHWQEDPPHMVTLSRPYYMAECPATQEIYQAVMGNNPSRLKDPKLPVHNVSCVDVYRFCRILSQKSGRKVRMPTAAQWEYAARVGTSNPTFPERYADQNSNANSKYDSEPLPVKSRKANAWGFYDVHGGWWERVSDGTRQIDRTSKVDPQHIPREDKGEADPNRKHGHMGKGHWTYAISEIEYITSEPGDVRFRVVVEAEPAVALPATGRPEE